VGEGRLTGTINSSHEQKKAKKNLREEGAGKSPPCVLPTNPEKVPKGDWGRDSRGKRKRKGKTFVQLLK